VHGATAGPCDWRRTILTGPARYEREEGRIRAVLGDRIRLLEHVGSTSVPGLTAKPIIDLLAVADISQEAAYVAALEATGYRLAIREPGWHEHRMLTGPGDGVHLHVFTDDSPEIRRMIAFRDRLRADDGERATDEAAKRRLASRDWTYVQDYADAKGTIVEAIVARALASDTGASPA
jgi:GrpB-like predicted nucleotidyltransferase (UPF0157 family)